MTDAAWSLWTPYQIANASQCPLANVRLNWPLIYRELVRKGVASKLSQIGAIGTVAIETASTFEPVREAYWMSESWRATHHRYYPYDGRGFIQLTWDYNYVAAEREIPILGLVAHPELAMEPLNAAKIFAWFWARKNVHHAAERRDWKHVRRLVLGAEDGWERIARCDTWLL